MEKLGIYDLWLSFQTTVNTFQGGWYRPQTDFIQKVNDIQMALWVKWTNEAEKSQQARDNLIFFLKSKNIIAKQSNGNFSIVTPPIDYGRFSSMSIVFSGEKTYPNPDVDSGKCDGWMDKESAVEEYYSSLVYSDVKLIDNDKWSACLQHLTKMPTLNKPKATQINEQWQVAPRGVSVVVFSYYIQPSPAVFAYTIAAGNRQTGAGAQIIFDKNKSVNLSWPPTVKNEFIVRLGEAYGLFTREQFLTQYNGQKAVA
jgi:hypothetical protein